MRRFWRDERGLSPIVEAVIMMTLLIAFFGGFSAYLLAGHARSVVIAAADTAARTASVECGVGNATWQSDAAAAAGQVLQDGGLDPVNGLSSTQPGYWTAQVAVNGGCPGASQVSAFVQFNQRNVFPFLGPLLAGGSAESPYWPIRSSVVFPVE